MKTAYNQVMTWLPQDICCSVSAPCWYTPPGLAFMVCAIAVAMQLQWWLWLAMAATLVSFDLTIIGWPESRIGVAVNVLIVVLLVGRAVGWIAVA